MISDDLGIPPAIHFAGQNNTAAAQRFHQPKKIKLSSFLKN